MGFTFQWSYFIFAIIGLIACGISVTTVIATKVEPPEHLRVSDAVWRRRNRIADAFFALAYFLFALSEGSHMFSAISNRITLYMLIVTGAFFLVGLGLRIWNNRKAPTTNTTKES